MHSRLQGRAHSGITRCKSTQQFAACTNNRLRHALHPRNPCAPCKASVRQKKDPSSFRDMDEAREYLHAEANWSGPVAGLLNWLSNSAFGAQKGGLNLGNLYRQWLHQQNQQQQADSSRSSSSSSGAGAAAAASAPDLVAKLAVLMLVSEHRVQIMADKYPQVLDIPLTDIAQRLLLLKQLLPDCDVARMVELQPLMLLTCDEQYLLEVVKPRVDVLTAELPGANISGMVEEDPRLLFEELESSLPRFHELWPGRLLDESAFAASDPTELGLALRALSDKGPPRKY